MPWRSGERSMKEKREEDRPPVVLFRACSGHRTAVSPCPEVLRKYVAVASVFDLEYLQIGRFLGFTDPPDSVANYDGFKPCEARFRSAPLTSLNGTKGVRDCDKLTFEKSGSEIDADIPIPELFPPSDHVGYGLCFEFL